jgi:hypothetical protein
MEAFESALGRTILLLAGIAFALGVTILVLYEAIWTISLGTRLYRRCRPSIRRFLNRPGDAPEFRPCHGEHAVDSSSANRDGPLAGAQRATGQARPCATDTRKGGEDG